MKRLKEMHALERGNTPEPIVDEEFLANHTQGWDALAERLESLSWDEIVEKSGVKGYGMKTLIHASLNSPIFLKK
jgi:anaerobic selenocysteine-containing dehydrogenase